MGTFTGFIDELSSAWNMHGSVPNGLIFISSRHGEQLSIRDTTTNRRVIHSFRANSVVVAIRGAVHFLDADVIRPIEYVGGIHAV